MSSTQTATATEVKTLVITLAVGGGFAIAAALIFGWHSIDAATEERTRIQASSLVPTIVEISRH